MIDARILMAAVASIVVPACSTPDRLPAVPPERTTDAVVPGIPAARFYVDVETDTFLQAGIDAAARERAALRLPRPQPMPPAHFLAISGGGDNGAFGAGVLVGWTAAGTRPEFKAVTGVSTGALSAPFAFLGPEYDDQLKAVYTTISARDVAEFRGPLAALYNDALADNAPLFGLVERYADQAMLERIAEEYAKGRLLLIATTDLDSRRPVIWNVGEIAASGDPDALSLFHRILIASAAIPGAFPPVMIDVELEGERHEEMHVDGGTLSQIVLYPPGISIAEESARREIERERTLYLIRNARLDPEWASVDRRTVDIASRAISALIHSQGIGDLYRLYLTSQRDGLDYHLAYIPAEFDAPRTEEFDPEYMNALFDLGYELALGGYPWDKGPPGFDAPAESEADGSS